MSSFSQIMCAQSRSNTKITAFTVALLESTGWYLPDYTMVQDSTWGKGKGCDFLTSNCKTSPKFDEFCTSTDTNTNSYCTKDLSTKSMCATETFSSSCEIYSDNQSQGDCTDLANDLSQNNKFTYEKYGYKSFCHLSNIIKTGYSFSLKNRCYETVCSESGGLFTMTISVSSEKLICTESDQGKTVTVRNSEWSGMFYFK
jgi:leishmanolysin